MNLIGRLKNHIFLIIFILLIFISFSQFFIKGLLPVPSDAIVGLYHPYRDFYSSEYPNGIPFKNFLITDPIRQIYPWKKLSIDMIRGFKFPLWNPYAGSGVPLLANFQSAVFYPLNIIFFTGNFPVSWSYFILLQPILAGLFTYFYLKNLKLDNKASFLGAISFCFSGFFISWLEWGNIIHTTLWLPLILLTIDKLVFSFKYKVLFIINKVTLFWSFIFVLSLISSFFAGHLQIFFYVIFFSSCYFIVRWIQFGKKIKVLIVFAVLYFLFAILTSVQWLPTLQFIQLSARSVDQSEWSKSGWFIPWQNLIQFIAPDFFGNPATLNYWGVWNYAELVGYIGLIPLMFAMFAIITRFDKKTFFYSTAFLVSLLFSLPTPFAKIPYILNIPFISTSQPTRLLSITCFSLAVLSSFGFDYFLKKSEFKKTFRNISLVIFSFSLLFISIWIFVLFINQNLNWIPIQNLIVSKRNLLFPTLILILFSFAVVLIVYARNIKYRGFIIIFLLILITFDFLRFASKFEPFTVKKYLFPVTKTINYLKNQKPPFRIATTDSRIFPPNLPAYYKIESIEQYDPLYLLSYAQFIAASQRGKPDISPPFGYNRIITPHNMDSNLIDLLNVKYILSLNDLDSSRFRKVFSEGETKVYENINVLPRIFFIEHVFIANNDKEAINKLFEKDFNFKTYAVVQLQSQNIRIPTEFSKGIAIITSYSENKIIIETENRNFGFLVLTDSYYPAWHARIYNYDLSSLTDAEILRTDYNFRGLIIPKGRNRVEFYINLL